MKPARSVLVRGDGDVDDIIKLAYEQNMWTPIKENTPIEPKVKTLGYFRIFQPKSFDEYVGQTESIFLSKMMVEAAKNESRPLPNIMIVGEYGLGKTTLARLIIQAYGASERIYDGSSINKEIPESGTILVDEIHNLKPDVSDALNVKLDAGQLTIIGATTNPGGLPLAFRSRFRTLFLEDYTHDELVLILKHICERSKTKYLDEGLIYLAQRSRFNARAGIQLLGTTFDYMSISKESTLTRDIAASILERLGIDDNGLLPRDRKYLSSLNTKRPVGLTYLSAVLGIDEETIEREVEPYLLRAGYIDRTSRGRILIGR